MNYVTAMSICSNVHEDGDADNGDTGPWQQALGTCLRPRSMGRSSCVCKEVSLCRMTRVCSKLATRPKQGKQQWGRPSSNDRFECRWAKAEEVGQRRSRLALV
ncbi:hypothetical protein GOP47_0030797 [Adiantum capillus-veneris]|nr:hypothetical protein GOP47_0030797 [Adiantum capillus-veneris]